MPLKIGKAEFADAVENSELPVLVDFYSDSCIPCKRMSPILSQLESEYADRLKLVKINTNFEKELTEQFQILAAPTLVLFDKGKEITRIRGAVKKEEIVALIQQYL